MTDKSAMMEKLDARHLLLDSSAAPGTAWCFRSLQELFASGALQDGTPDAPMTVYLVPDVYWLHDPEDEEIFRGTEGDFLPYQQKIKCNYLSLIGLSEHPEDVVIAANKGQSHGCIGNYTMLHFEGDGLHLENLTIGNYCNVDLEYPRDPSKNRPKRCKAVTQAQLGDVVGDRFHAKNCRFISRLNLYPICGAKRSLYENCHFESTDDALNGNAVYLHCDFDFYGGCPIFATDATGSAFLDCLFRICGHRDKSGADQYFMKGQGCVYVIGLRFEDLRKESMGTSRALQVQWTRYPQPETMRYAYGNDTPIGPAEHTVDLTEKGGAGSAGQYMDVCVGFDAQTMTGPALRILRSQEASNAVAVFPVYYEKGLASPIGERCYTAGFVTGCRIEVQIRDGRLRAHLWTEKELPPSVEYPSEITVDTKAAAAGGSVGVLHTGTCGTGGWQNTVMLHGLRAE